MKSTLPKAWARLLEEEDELLLELVADRVENLCGYKPDPDTVARFLKENVALKSVPAATPQSPSRSQTPTPVTIPSTPRIGPSQKPSSIGFVLDGRHYPARSAREVLEGVFEALTKRDTNILVVGFVLRSDRRACILQIRDKGLLSHAENMAFKKRQTIRR